MSLQFKSDRVEVKTTKIKPDLKSKRKAVNKSDKDKLKKVFEGYGTCVI